MKLHIERRLLNPRGKQTLYRNRHLYAKILKLNDAEYRLLDLYGALIVWDKKNYPEQYESVQASDKQISDILRWSVSKVCRTKNKLIEKKLVRMDGIADYKVLLIFNKEIEVDALHNVFTNKQNDVAVVTNQIANLQTISGQNINSSICSYKLRYVSLKSRDEYIDVKKQVDDLTEQITKSDGWFSEDPKLEEMVDKQQYLANLMLVYEIENDLLPI